LPSAAGAFGVIGVALIARALLPGWLGPGGRLASLVILGALAYAIVVYKTGPELLRALRRLVGDALQSGAPHLRPDCSAEDSSIVVTTTSAKE
jgi:hypothetical protein